jgi:hypothetical protein
VEVHLDVKALPSVPVPAAATDNNINTHIVTINSNFNQLVQLVYHVATVAYLFLVRLVLLVRDLRYRDLLPRFLFHLLPQFRCLNLLSRFLGRRVDVDQYALYVFLCRSMWMIDLHPRSGKVRGLSFITVVNNDKHLSWDFSMPSRLE